MDFNSLNYKVPIGVMRDTKEFLIEQGRKDHEAFVLWKGKQETDSTYIVTGVIIPEQRAIRSAFGYAFDLSEKSINNVLNELHRTNEIGLIQVHSHPGSSAIHSSRDNELSLLGRKGSLSIVLPFFGNIEFENFSKTKVHILTDLHLWQILSPNQVNQMLTIMR
mgnify:CR=1 FL=1